jgi:hypothetical protein
MPDAKSERRSGPRIPVRVQVSISSPKDKDKDKESVETAGYTRDLSMNGIFLYTEAQIQQGSELEMVLILPSELTQGEKRWVCCQAAVVRVEKSAEGGGFGVAASIKSIEILPEILGS